MPADRRTPAARRRRRDVEAVAATLQQYADRAVFRGLTVQSGAGGATTFRFRWLTRTPTVVRLDREASRLTFVDLLPGVDRRSPMGKDLAALVRARSSRELPAHKRIDARRASVGHMVRRGAWWLVISMRGPDAAYAVRYALNLVNDVFLLLHEAYPDYLVEHFGMSSE